MATKAAYRKEIGAWLDALKPDELAKVLQFLELFFARPTKRAKKPPRFDVEKYLGAFKAGGAKMPTREEIYEERLAKQVPRH